jgi:hypothetical protein
MEFGGEGTLEEEREGGDQRGDAEGGERVRVNRMTNHRPTSLVAARRPFVVQAKPLAPFSGRARHATVMRVTPGIAAVAGSRDRPRQADSPR